VTRVVIAGGSGLIGRALTSSLLADGLDVDVLSRDPRRRAGSVADSTRLVGWVPSDPATVARLAAALEGADAVVNLCGMPVGPLPWTAGRRRAIFDSRVISTVRLVEAMARLGPSARPGAFVCASGIDGYTDLDATHATETTDIGATTGFLADVGRAWESSADRATALGVRTVMVRTSFVLARGSGLMQLLALPVRLGLGGRYGSGDQWFSWIHLDDLVATYRLAIADAGIAGPLIAATPHPVRQRELAAALAHVLHRPNWLPLPASVLRLMLREESTLLLGSRRVVPARLLEAGFSFRFINLEMALQEVLGPSAAA